MEARCAARRVGRRIAARRRDIHTVLLNQAAARERVIADYHGVDPEPPNSKSDDVVAQDGTTIQVKALRRTKSSRRNLSPLRTLDFDYVAAVIFATDMQLVEAVFVPVAAVRDHMSWSNTWKAHRLALTKRLLDDPRVRRVPAAELVARSFDSGV